MQGTIDVYKYDFNPRPPCGERQFAQCFEVLVEYFNPRPPCGERLCVQPFPDDLRIISIHAPHAGSDMKIANMPQEQYNFNPRPPCGERPIPAPALHEILTFQSTPPMRGATTVIGTVLVFTSISIHAPHAGSDRKNAHF